MEHGPLCRVQLELEAVGHNYHGGLYEDHTTDLCVDPEFTVQKRSSVVDGRQYPYSTSLFRRTDRSGIEGNATECG